MKQGSTNIILLEAKKDVAATVLRPLIRIFDNPPIPVTIRTNPLSSPITLVYVHVTIQIEIRAWRAVDRFGCVIG